MAQFATVVAVTGKAFAINMDGKIRAIRAGDKIEEDEIIQTAAGGHVELQMVDGQTMSVAPEHALKLDESVAESDQRPTAQDSALTPTTADTVIQALERGGDLNAELEATAAGATGGATGQDNSGIVRLLRVSEGVSPLAYDYTFAAPDVVLAVPPAGVLATGTPPTISIGVTVLPPGEQSGGPSGPILPGDIPQGAVSGTTVTEGSNGGDTAVTFVIMLDHVSTTDVTITYTIVPVTATFGTDYHDGNIQGTVTIPAGYVGFTITEFIVGDTLFEPDETFNIVLSNPVGATLGVATATVTILNDDFPVFTLSGDATVNEGAAANYAITLTGASIAAGQSVTLTIGTGLVVDTAAEGVDYNSHDGTLTVTAPAGGWAIGAQVASFTVQTSNDTLYEGNETYTVQLTGTTLGTAGGSVVTTIVDNEVPALTGLRVSEEGLAAGLPDSGPNGTLDTTDAVTAIGTTNIANSLDARLVLPATGLTSGGTLITWTLSTDGHTLTGSVEPSQILQVVLTQGGSGTWTTATTIYGKVDHPVQNDPATVAVETSFEDVLAIAVGVNLYATTLSSSVIGTGTLTVSVEDDSPTNYAPTSILVHNAIDAITTESLNSVSHIGADGYPLGITQVRFNPAQEGDSGLTTNGSTKIYYWVSADGATLYASTSSTEGGVDTSTLTNVVFTIAINNATDQYTVHMYGTVFNNSGSSFGNLSGTGEAGNPSFKIVESTTADTLEVLFTPRGTANSVNSDSNDVAAGSQFIQNGGGLRMDFGSFSYNTNGTGTNGDDFYQIDGTQQPINGFRFSLNQVVGTTATVKLTAYDTNNDQIVTNDTPDTINKVSIYDALGHLVGTFTGDGSSGGITVDFLSGGDAGKVSVSGLLVGYSIVTYTADGYTGLAVDNTSDLGKYSLSDLQITTV